MAQAGTNTQMDRYERLLQGILREKGSEDVTHVKQYFSDIIGSKRAMSKISTLEELIVEFQELDAISMSNVRLLEHVCERLKFQKALNSVRAYKKCLEADEVRRCTVCGYREIEQNITLQLSAPAASENLSQNQTSHFPSNNSNMNNNLNHHPTTDELFPVLCFVKENLGGRWECLARILGVKEGDIDTITLDYQHSRKEQSFQALCKWRQQRGQDATVHELIEALKHYTVNRKDIADKLAKQSYRR